MPKVKGTPGQGLLGATLGFFIGFAAVALFGPTANKFQQVMHLSPMAVGFLVAMPALSGSLLRIPFSAWVDTTGGRKPFLVLLSLSVAGMAGLSAVVTFLYPTRLTADYYALLLFLAVLCGCGIATFSVGVSQVSYWFPKRKQGSAMAIFGGAGNIAPGIFSVLIPMALGSLGLTNSYLIWLGMLGAGTVLYFLIGRNSPYFQLRAQGMDPDKARREAAAYGQALFPAGSLKDSLAASARVWRTWALVLVYFTTFGGFIALTAWLPTYWTAYYGMTPIQAGALTALYSVLTSLIRILGGVISDRLREGGENTAILALVIMLMGALVMTGARDYQMAIPGVILLAVGMGLCNAAVFKLVPQAVPHAVGGAAGWVGGLGAFGGFAIPPMLAFAVRDLGKSGFAIGFVVYLFLALFSLTMVWILKYSEQAAAEPVAAAGRATA
jgi:NNP family nitrate/nitrite transporter-like MFS transporter